MGEKFLLLWFSLPVDKLKAIREKEYDKLSKMEQAQLDELIAKKEKEANETK